ncbi:10024_t:CDS:1, partial [Dentiscutata heterogama]
SESVQKKYRGIKFKKYEELLTILEEVRSLINSDDKSENCESIENLGSQHNDEL